MQYRQAPDTVNMAFFATNNTTFYPWFMFDIGSIIQAQYIATTNHCQWTIYQCLDLALGVSSSIWFTVTVFCAVQKPTTKTPTRYLAINITVFAVYVISKYGVFIRSKSDAMDTAVKSLMIGTTTLSDTTNLTMIGTNSSSCSHHCPILQLLCFDTFISQRFRVGLSSIVDSNDATIWLEYM